MGYPRESRWHRGLKYSSLIDYVCLGLRILALDRLVFCQGLFYYVLDGLVLSGTFFYPYAEWYGPFPILLGKRK